MLRDYRKGQDPLDRSCYRIKVKSCDVPRTGGRLPLEKIHRSTERLIPNYNSPNTGRTKGQHIALTLPGTTRGRHNFTYGLPWYTCITTFVREVPTKINGKRLTRLKYQDDIPKDEVKTGQSPRQYPLRDRRPLERLLEQKWLCT